MLHNKIDISSRLALVNELQRDHKVWIVSFSCKEHVLEFAKIIKDMCHIISIVMVMMNIKIETIGYDGLSTKHGDKTVAQKSRLKLPKPSSTKCWISSAIFDFLEYNKSSMTLQNEKSIVLRFENLPHVESKYLLRFIF